MLLRATVIAAAIAMAALAMAGLGPGLAHADRNQRCTAPVWVTDMGIPIGSRTTCFNADGSYGSPSAKDRIAADLAEHRHDLTVRKEILWESETATDAEVRTMERRFICDTGANNPAIGYNLTPRWFE
jgi:hypothetical protein